MLEEKQPKRATGKTRAGNFIKNVAFHAFDVASPLGCSQSDRPRWERIKSHENKINRDKMKSNGYT